ncbi:MAG TPA: phage holin family protein [Gaiellales bacterium]|jgi:tetrahydromethanopterin S-methyltransferase subunit C
MSGSSLPERDDRSVSELTKELLRDVSALVRRELDLAKAELAEKVRQLGLGIGLAAAGAVLLLVALGALTATAIIALATAMDTWLAALIVTIVVAVAGAIVALMGVRVLRRGAPPVPDQTVESVKEDIAWVKTRAKSGSR